MEIEIMFDNLIWLRLAQFKINDLYKSGIFKIPIHLALGHEAIAVSINNALNKNDHLLLTHRNIHYNLIATKNIKLELNEFLLKKNGLAKGKLGSMNLSNKSKNILYSSSILGNNLPVACGVAFGKKINEVRGVTFVVTGDGAIEEGVFYESLIMAKTLKLPMIFVVENNGWSLGTSISERRCSIDLNKVSESLNINYTSLESNNLNNYYNEIKKIKKISLTNNCPAIIEIKLKTLGYWIKKDQNDPNGRLINYHAGPAKEINKNNPLIIENSYADPLYVLQQLIGSNALDHKETVIRKKIDREI
jgi:TPP-dependent pyruvate/acetoin dehydrogenase alpha subunit